MRARTTSRTPLAALALALAALLSPGADGARRSPAFVENRGQWAADVAYVARVGPLAAALSDDGIWIDLRGPAARGVTLHLRVVDVAVTARAEGRRTRRGVTHYLIGDDPARWRVDVPRYDEAWLRGAAEGVDLRLRFDGGVPRYDVEFAADAGARELVFEVQGAEGLRLEPDGRMTIETAIGDLTQSAPVAFVRDGPAAGRPVESRCELLGRDRFRLRFVDAADEPVVIDPALEWSSFLGGSSWESSYAVALGPDGDAYVVGQSGSQDFPTTPGAYDTSFNGPAFSDVVVSRLADDGQALIYSTFIGGSGGDEARSVAVDEAGRAVVVGTTNSANFPVTAGGSVGPTGGSSDAFVLRLDAAGGGLLHSVRVGGGSGDVAESVHPLPGGDEILVVGTTSSADFPVTAGALDGVLDGSSDAFLVRYDLGGGGLGFATFVGGSAGDTGEWVGLRPDDTVAVAGTTSSSDLPLGAAPLDGVLDGNSDAYVLAVDADGAVVVAGTLLGGAAGDTGESLAVAADGEVVVAGVTSSGDFPITPSAFDSTPAGTSDAFVARLDAGLGALVFSTLYGGSSGDVITAVGLDAGESPIAGGVTSSGDLPLSADAFDATPAGSSDAFVVRLDPSGASLEYATYLGGGKGDVGESLTVDPKGRATIVGTTSSGDFPVTAGVPDPVGAGSSEGFVSRLRTCDGFAVPYGEGCPGSGGFVPRLAVGGCPVPGKSVRIEIADGLGGSSAVVFLGTSEASLPMDGGCVLWISPLLVGFGLPLLGAGPGDGEISVRATIPATVPGPVELTLQAFCVDPGGAAGYSNTHGLRLRIE